MKNQTPNTHQRTGCCGWQKLVLNFKPLIFAVMCIFTLSACETTSTPPVDYPVVASYDKTFLKNHSRQADDGDYKGVAIALGAIIGTFLVLALIGAATGAGASSEETRTCFETRQFGRVMVPCRN
ncbi:MAG: hypothetical protein ACNYPD_08545 [Candidatus Halichondribacter symbioticus]